MGNLVRIIILTLFALPCFSQSCVYSDNVVYKTNVAIISNNFEVEQPVIPLYTNNNETLILDKNSLYEGRPILNGATISGNEVSVLSDFYIFNCFNSFDFSVNVATDNTATRKVLYIGDSLTDSGNITGSAYTRFQSDAMTINFIGTQDGVNNANEGYSGKTYQWFATHEDSPFVFAGVFDFAQYLSSNSITLGNDDWVIFQLGTNDIFAESDCETNYNTNIKPYLDLILSDINTVVPNARIGLSMIHTTNTSETRWAQVYVPNGAVWKGWFEECQVHFNNKIVSDYPNMKILPYNYALDGNTDIYDAVHPTNQGYSKIGDYLYYFLKYHQ